MRSVFFKDEMMMKETLIPADFKVLCNHIYEFKKGVRNLVLHTMNIKYVDQAVTRLKNQNIDYVIQPAGDRSVNIFFGEPECLEAISSFIHKPLNMLSPEQDFMLGALLGYDICKQCKRFCQRKKVN